MYCKVQLTLRCQKHKKSFEIILRYVSHPTLRRNCERPQLNLLNVYNALCFFSNSHYSVTWKSNSFQKFYRCPKPISYAHLITFTSWRVPASEKLLLVYFNNLAKPQSSSWFSSYQLSLIIPEAIEIVRFFAVLLSSFKKKCVLIGYNSRSALYACKIPEARIYNLYGNGSLISHIGYNCRLLTLADLSATNIIQLNIIRFTGHQVQKT